MEVHVLTVHVLLGVIHTFDEHAVGCAGRHVTIDEIGLLQRVLFQSLTRSAALLSLTLVLVDSIRSLARLSLDRRQDQIVEPHGKRLSAGRIANHEHTIVQALLLVGLEPVAVGASCHQRTEESCTNEEGCGPHLTGNTLTDLTQTRIIGHQSLNLIGPLGKRQDGTRFAGTALGLYHTSRLHGPLQLLRGIDVGGVLCDVVHRTLYLLNTPFLHDGLHERKTLHDGRKQLGIVVADHREHIAHLHHRLVTVALLRLTQLVRQLCGNLGISHIVIHGRAS